MKHTQQSVASDAAAKVAVSKHSKDTNLAQRLAEFEANDAALQKIIPKLVENYQQLETRVAELERERATDSRPPESRHGTMMAKKPNNVAAANAGARLKFSRMFMIVPSVGLSGVAALCRWARLETF